MFPVFLINFLVALLPSRDVRLRVHSVLGHVCIAFFFGIGAGGLASRLDPPYPLIIAGLSAVIAYPMLVAGWARWRNRRAAAVDQTRRPRTPLRFIGNIVFVLACVIVAPFYFLYFRVALGTYPDLVAGLLLLAAFGCFMALIAAVAASWRRSEAE